MDSPLCRRQYLSVFYRVDGQMDRQNGLREKNGFITVIFGLGTSSFYLHSISITVCPEKRDKLFST